MLKDPGKKRIGIRRTTIGVIIVIVTTMIMHPDTTIGRRQTTGVDLPNLGIMGTIEINVEWMTTKGTVFESCHITIGGIISTTSTYEAISMQSSDLRGTRNATKVAAHGANRARII